MCDCMNAWCPSCMGTLSSSRPTPPDKRDWVDITDYDLNDQAVTRQLLATYRDTAMMWMRYTMIKDTTTGRTWACIDSWKVRPAEQDEPPTASDIPQGFV